MASPNVPRTRSNLELLPSTQPTLPKQIITPKTVTKTRRNTTQSNSKSILETQKQIAPMPRLVEQYKTKLSNATTRHKKPEQPSISIDQIVKTNKQMSLSRTANSKLSNPKQMQANKLQRNLFGNQEIAASLSLEDSQNFSAQKKSYRKQYHPHIVCVPYRKCHSSIQEKVVGIINKLHQGKPCLREILSLVDKVGKVSMKELTNRYFISGLHVIKRLVTLNFDCKDGNEVGMKLEECLNQLLGKIEQGLECGRQFEVERSEGKIEKCWYSKQKIIKRAYGILRKKMREQSKEEVREKAIQTANCFLDSTFPNVLLLLQQLSAV